MRFYYLIKFDIKVPDIIEIVLKLKEKNIDVNIKDWTITELINEIVKVCKNEKYRTYGFNFNMYDTSMKKFHAIFAYKKE